MRPEVINHADVICISTVLLGTVIPWDKDKDMHESTFQNDACYQYTAYQPAHLKLLGLTHALLQTLSP